MGLMETQQQKEWCSVLGIFALSIFGGILIGTYGELSITAAAASVGFSGMELVSGANIYG